MATELTGKLIVYQHPNIPAGFLAKITGTTTEGFTLVRCRFFKGKNTQTYAQNILPDPAFHNIDKWTREHGLPPMLHCPLQWLTEKKATFYEPAINIPAENTPGVIWEILRSNLITRKENSSLTHKIHDRLYRHYTTQQYTESQNLRKELAKQSLQRENSQKQTPSGINQSSIVQHQTAVFQRGLFAIINYCESALAATGKTLADFIQPMRQWENTRMDYLIKKTPSPEKWEGINEFVDPPPPIKHQVKIETPWDKIPSSRQLLFTQNLKQAQLIQS